MLEGLQAVVTADESSMRTVAQRFRDAAWSVGPGWDLPPEPFDLTPDRRCCVATVTTTAERAGAVYAAVRGTAVVVHCPDDEMRAELVDELERVLPVEVVDTASVASPLDEDQRALLDALADGATIAEAAQRCFLSVRTAERRLAAARKTLGVRTTTEAVRALRRLG